MKHFVLAGLLAVILGATGCVGYRPATTVEVGVKRFVDWFCEYYGYKR